MRRMAISPAMNKNADRTSTSREATQTLCPGGGGQIFLRRRRQQIIDELPSLLWMRTAFDDRHRVWNEERAELTRLAIGIDNYDGACPVDLNHSVIGVGQSKSNLSGCCGLSNL